MHEAILILTGLSFGAILGALWMENRDLKRRQCPPKNNQHDRR